MAEAQSSSAGLPRDALGRGAGLYPKYEQQADERAGYNSPTKPPRAGKGQSRSADGRSSASAGAAAIRAETGQGDSRHERGPVARDHAVRHRGGGRAAPDAARRAADLRARRRQPALRPDRRPRGDPRDRLHRARPQLGHLQPGPREPQGRPGAGPLRGELRRDLQGCRAGAALPREDQGRERRHADLRGQRAGGQRLHHQPHGLRRAAPDRGRGGRAGRGAAHRRPSRARTLPGADRPDVPVPGHPRAEPRGPAGRERDLHDAGRRLRDGGSPQLDRCLLQDLYPPARQALALHAGGRRDLRAVGDARDRAAGARGRRGRGGAGQARGRRRRRPDARGRAQPAARARPPDAAGGRSGQGDRPAVPGLPVRFADRRRLRRPARRRPLDLPVRPPGRRARPGARRLPGDRRGDRGRDGARGGARLPRPQGRALGRSGDHAPRPRRGPRRRGGLRDPLRQGRRGARLRSQMHAARQRLAGLPAGRGDLRRGARGLPRGRDRRRHALLLHRAQPQAAAGRRSSTSSSTPPARSCTRPTTPR